VVVVAFPVVAAAETGQRVMAAAAVHTIQAKIRIISLKPDQETDWLQ
jgi:hypothetical protein